MRHRNTLNPSFIAIIASIGMFLSTLDSGIINIAIPTLVEVFQTRLDIVIWTVTLYTLVLSATIMLFGQLADRFGRLKIYQSGLMLFAASSLLCGLSPNIEFLIVARALQGLSAAMLQATAIAIITTRLEKTVLTKALGLLGMLMGLGPTMGPVLGGFLLSSIGWRWIFWINIPICLYGLYGCRKLAHENEVLHTQALNYINLALFGTAMLLLLLSMNYVAKNLVIAGILLAGMLIIFSLHIYAEINSKNPTIHYSLFKKITFTAPMLGIIAFGGATAIAFILPPLFFENLKNYTPWQVGLISLSAPLGIVIAARISARLTNFCGTYIPMIAGMMTMTIVLFTLTQITIYWTANVIFCLLLIYGLGGGCFQIPSIMHLTKQFPIEKQAFISSLIRMLQNTSIALCAAGSAMLINSNASIAKNHLLEGIQHSWTLAAILTLFALIALLFFWPRD